MINTVYKAIELNKFYLSSNTLFLQCFATYGICDAKADRSIFVQLAKEIPKELYITCGTSTATYLAVLVSLWKLREKNLCANYFNFRDTIIGKY